jgi:thymidine phosphorylase
MAAVPPPEIIRVKRDGGTLSADQIDAFVRGLVDGGWSDSQAAALAMAIVCRGMDAGETAALTRAMADSGERLSWRGAGLRGPVLDKHSTGGVGDKVSLILAPVIAACGGVVPMISGRGLGHTGGTLDKLEALPGYRTDPPRETLLAALRDAGCAIVGASDRLAPADRRLYAIRDVTATVESMALITASILSKKLAAGLDALVMDVKAGSGAFCRTAEEAERLARTIVDVAAGAGLPTTALVTDMDAVLGRSAGNALEVDECLRFLDGRARDARLAGVVSALAAEMLVAGGLAASRADGAAQAAHALDSGAAARRFALMVAALGGPTDVFRAPGLPRAPLQRPVLSPRTGFVVRLDARALGIVVVALGGGRTVPGTAVDPRVGLDAVAAPGQRVEAGEPLAVVHAATDAAAESAVRQVSACFEIGPGPPLPRPLVLARVAATAERA